MTELRKAMKRFEDLSATDPLGMTMEEIVEQHPEYAAKFADLLNKFLDDVQVVVAELNAERNP